MTLRFLCGLALCLGLWAALPVQAQDDDGGDFIDGAIAYGQTVTGTITDDAYFDWWRFGALRGDEITITMAASGGLAPLIGLLNSESELLARSDDRPQGIRVDSPPNGTAVLRFTIQQEGRYIINTTRVGTVDGTTTGRYTLALALNSGGRSTSLQDVTFLCRANTVTTAASFAFREDTQYSGTFRISVFGLDGFRPVIRTETTESTECTSEGDALAGTAYTLPGEDTVTLPDELPIPAAQLTLEQPGAVILTVGSIDGAAGRYILLIEGFSIRPADDTDQLVARLGPLAAETSMRIYMLRAENTRIDPYIEALLDSTTGERADCDDAGRRDCADIPAATEYSIVFPDGRRISGDRLDAGVTIATGSPSPVTLTLGSRSGRTEGAYHVLVVGQLPPR